MRIEEKFDKKLLVEGNDDQHVIWSICQKNDIHENFDVIDSEGIDKLFESIPVRLKVSGVKTIGIIIDADIELETRWKKLSAILSKEGYTVPQKLPDIGLILNPAGKVEIGIWIMPNNQTNGMIEDFIGFLVPEDDKLLPEVNSSLDTIEKRELNKYNSIHKSKALIHTWLSWQEDPGTPMGLAITKKYLTTDKKICSILVKWLNSLFNS